MSKIKKIFTNTGSTSAYALMSAILALVPEELFTNGIFQCDWPLMIIVIVNRIIVFVVIFAFANLIYYCCKKYRKSVSITRKNVSISIEYGNIFEVTKGKKVINFDECFNTKVGQMPGDIKPDSICGQYLAKYPIEDMQNLLQPADIHPVGVSKYNKQPKYKLGTIMPRDNFFLMAFTELDKDGLSRMTYEHYLDCLDFLWQEIDKYHGTEDVYIPIIGSKITRLDKELSQQELLDVMIASYRLSPHKLKNPHTLHIVCKERDGFTLNDIWGVK
jgi:hypothetical protein